MPDTGSPYFLPYATLTDEADANKYLKALAEAQDAALKMLVPRSSRFKATSQSITAAGTFQTIQWDAEEALPQGSVAIPYSNGIWTIQQAGVYFVSATAHLQQTSGTPQFRLNINFTGSWAAAGTITVHQSNVNANADAVKAIRLAVGDTIAVQAFCETTAGLVYGHASVRYTTVDITRIAP